jgi:hypothetical protein
MITRTTHETIIATTIPTLVPVRRGAGGVVGAVGNGVVGNGVVGKGVVGAVVGAGVRVLSAKTGLGSASIGSCSGLVSVTTALAACSARFSSIQAAVRSV